MHTFFDLPAAKIVSPSAEYANVVKHLDRKLFELINFFLNFPSILFVFNIYLFSLFLAAVTRSASDTPLPRSFFPSILAT